MSTDEHRRRQRSGRYDCLHDTNGYCDAALYADWEREQATNAAVAAELRAQAAFLDRAIDRRGNGARQQNINKAYAFMARVFRDRAAELDPPARQED